MQSLTVTIGCNHLLPSDSLQELLIPPIITMRRTAPRLPPLAGGTVQLSYDGVIDENRKLDRLPSEGALGLDCEESSDRAPDTRIR